MLLAAARTLVPDHDIGLPLSRRAVHAGLSRRVAAALFDATGEVAAALVRATWRRMAELMAQPAGIAPAAYIARLILVLRGEARVEHVRQALVCSMPRWEADELAEEEAALLFAVAEGLARLWPALGAEAPAISRRVLALARARDAAQGAARERGGERGWEEPSETPGGPPHGPSPAATRPRVAPRLSIRAVSPRRGRTGWAPG